MEGGAEFTIWRNFFQALPKQFSILILKKIVPYLIGLSRSRSTEKNGLKETIFFTFGKVG